MKFLPSRRHLLIACIILLGAVGLSLSGYKYGRNKLRAQLASTAGAHAPASEAAGAKPVDDIKLYLPKTIYATPGYPLKVVFDNLVDVPDWNEFQFKVECSLGTAERRFWTVTPTEKDVGSHPLEVRVSNFKGEVLGTASTNLVVSPATAGAGRSIRLLFVGDSLTHKSWHPAELKRITGQRGYPAINFIGTHEWPENPGIFHEAYGGWTWNCFLTYSDPGSGKKRHREQSPFLFKSESGELKLDVPRYLREHCQGIPPDLVIFQLGINDVYCQEHANIVKNSETLVSAFRKAAPDASLAIWLTQPVNASQAAFDHFYRNVAKIPRTKIKTNQHQLAQGLAKTFGDREREGYFLLPISVSLDPVDDYMPHDPVHPSLPGYQRVGQTIYAWLNYWLAQKEWRP
jgi:hypothetical protein